MPRLGVWIPLFLLCLLNACDAWLTWRLLSHGGMEVNPFVRSVILELGLGPSMLAKVFGGLVVIALLARFAHVVRPRATWALTLVFLAIVIHNLSMVQMVRA